jgi:hypothetical protein
VSNCSIAVCSRHITTTIIIVITIIVQQPAE